MAAHPPGKKTSTTASTASTLISTPPSPPPQPTSTNTSHAYLQNSSLPFPIPFTIADVLCVTRKAKKNSAPGLDGIPYSLYERASILQVLLIKVIQAAIQTGRFPSSWGLSYIRPRSSSQERTPSLPLLTGLFIALLCTDYKIFTSGDFLGNGERRPLLSLPLRLKPLKHTSPTCTFYLVMLSTWSCPSPSSEFISQGQLQSLPSTTRLSSRCSIF